MFCSRLQPLYCWISPKQLIQINKKITVLHKMYSEVDDGVKRPFKSVSRRRYHFRQTSKIFSTLNVRLHINVSILNKIINAPCGTLKLLLALGVAKYIKSYKNHFVVQYATDYCPLEHDNYKTISAHLGSPISCYINNLHGAFIFLLSVCFW